MERDFLDLNLELNASLENPTSGSSVSGGVQYWPYPKEASSVQVQEDNTWRKSDVPDFFPSSSKNAPIMMWNSSPTTSGNTVSHDHARMSAIHAKTSDTVYPMSLGGISSATQKSFFERPANFRENTKPFGPPSQPLTILWGNNVHVFDEISPRKAEAIMSMAKNAAPESTADTNLAQAVSGARKASVDRFLEKRKGR